MSHPMNAEYARRFRARRREARLCWRCGKALKSTDVFKNGKPRKTCAKCILKLEDYRIKVYLEGEGRAEIQEVQNRRS